MATKRGIPHEKIVEFVHDLAAGVHLVTEHARLHNITMIPIGEQATLQHFVAERVVLGSGRPTIVLPEEPRRRRPSSFDVVGVAWDFSRSAARAVADALPILERAKTVRVVTVTQEKTIDTMHSGSGTGKAFGLSRDQGRPGRGRGRRAPDRPGSRRICNRHDHRPAGDGAPTGAHACATSSSAAQRRPSSPARRCRCSFRID